MNMFDGTDWWDKPWERLAWNGESWLVITQETEGSED